MNDTQGQTPIHKTLDKRIVKDIATDDCQDLKNNKTCGNTTQTV